MCRMRASGPSCAAAARWSPGSRRTARCACARTRTRTITPRCPAARAAGARSRRCRCTRASSATDFATLRAPSPAVQFMGRVSWTLEETGVLLFRLRGWGLTALTIFGNYFLDLPQRLHSARDRRMTLGNALLGRLKLSLNRAGGQLWLRAPLTELIRTDSRRQAAPSSSTRVARCASRRGARWCSPPAASSAMRRCARSTCRRSLPSHAGAARRATTPAKGSSPPRASGRRRSTWTPPGGAPR